MTLAKPSAQARANDPDVIITECEQALLEAAEHLERVAALSSDQYAECPLSYRHDCGEAIGRIAALCHRLSSAHRAPVSRQIDAFRQIANLMENIRESQGWNEYGYWCGPRVHQAEDIARSAMG